MKLILVYAYLFCFWIEKGLHFRLSATTGLSLSNLVLYLFLAAWALSAIHKKRLFEKNNLNVWLFLLLVMVLMSIPLKIFLDEIPNVLLADELITFKGFATAIGLFFVAFNIIDDPKTCNRAMWGFRVLLVLTVLTTIFLPNLAKTQAYGRMSAFGEANQFGSYLVLFFPLMLMPAISNKSFLHRIAGVAGGLLTMLGLFMTGSRGGILSLAAGLIFYVHSLYRQRVLRVRGLVLFTAAFMSIVVGAFFFTPTEVKRHTIERFQGGGGSVEEPSGAGMRRLDEYTSGRTLLLWPGLKEFLKSPIYGHGQDSFRFLMVKYFRGRVNSHNDYLLYLVDYGIIGLVLLFMVWVKIGKHISEHIRTAQNAWDRQLYLSYLTGFLAYAISMIGLNVITPVYVFWLYTGIVYKYSVLRTKA